VENIENVNNGLKAASPWYLKFGVKSMAELG
jgi:tagatose 1,6-diphosphate aldolase